MCGVDCLCRASPGCGSVDQQREGTIIRSARIVRPLPARQIIHDVLTAQFIAAQVVEKGSKNVTRRHIGKMEHQVFRPVGSDCDSGVFLNGIQSLPELHFDLPARAQKMSLVGKLPFFRQENRHTDSFLAKNDRSVPHLKATDMASSRNRKGDREIKLLFRQIMFRGKIIFDLHQRAVHNPAEFDPLF